MFFSEYCSVLLFPAPLFRFAPFENAIPITDNILLVEVLFESGIEITHFRLSIARSEENFFL